MGFANLNPMFLMKVFYCNNNRIQSKEIVFGRLCGGGEAISWILKIWGVLFGRKILGEYFQGRRQNGQIYRMKERNVHNVYCGRK